MGGGSDGAGAHRFWSAADFSSYSSPAATSSLGSVEPNRAIVERAHHVNDAAIISEIDCTMTRHTDDLLRAVDGLSVRLSRLENRTHQLELSVDDLKVSVGNNNPSTDGEFRQMENILLEVQSSVQDLKNTMPINPAEQTTPAPQQSNNPQFSVASLQPFPSVSACAPPRQSIHQSLHLPIQYPPTHTSTVSQLDTLFTSASQTQEVLSLSQPFLLSPAQQQQQQTLLPPRGVEHQPYQQTPPSPYPQVAAGDDCIPSWTYPPSFNQPPSPPTSGSLVPFQHFPGAAASSHMYESYPYSGSSSHYGNDLAGIYQPHSSGTGENNYEQIPTAMMLPQAYPNPSTVDGGAIPAGSGNRVPIDDVVDKVASMGFPRECVRATVLKLTDNGQAINLNVVLEKLMNDDGEAQPHSGWFGR